MFCVYYYKAGASTANVSADIAKLLSNVPIANLSNDCDKVQTAILANTIPSNWEYIDQVGAKSIVRSLNADGTTYKYVSINPGLASDVYSNYSGIGIAIYENWNSSTHTGLNQGVHYGTRGASEIIGQYRAGAASPTYATAGGAHIYATSRSLMVDFAAVAEFTRDSLAIDSSYPCHIAFPLVTSVEFWGSLGYSTSNTYNTCNVAVCRYMSLAGGDVKYGNASNPVCYLATVTAAHIRDYYTTAQSTKFRTPADEEFLNGSPLYAKVALEFQYAKSTLGKVYDYIATYQAPIASSVFDEVQINGETYMCLCPTKPATLWVKKG